MEPGAVTGDTVTIQGPDARHICAVLRMAPGDIITVSTGEGPKLSCEISRIERDLVEAQVIGESHSKASTAPSITLAQALPKGRKMDDIIRMNCELGVEKIIPVITERCVARPDEAGMKQKVERWRAIAKAAAQQCRAHKPAMVADVSTIDEIPLADISITLWEEETASLKSALADSGEGRSLILVVGPEGGLSADEARRLTARGFVTASLGGTVLRTETAGLCAVSAALYHFSKA